MSPSLGINEGQSETVDQSIAQKDSVPGQQHAAKTVNSMTESTAAADWWKAMASQYALEK